MGRERYLISGIIVALAFLIPSMISDVYANPDISLSRCNTLDIPGETYVLDHDLTSSEVCFRIIADGITLDGNGHTITSLITSEQFENIGVDVSGTTGVTVKNLKISDFRTGITVTASDTSLINNFITNADTGIYISNSCVVTLTRNTANSGTDGIVITYSSGVTLTRNTANDNSDDGINISNSHGTVLTRNTAGISEGQSNHGISISSSNDNFLIKNTVSGNEAILLSGSSGNTLIKNTVESCTNCIAGIMILESNGNIISKNNVDSTHLWGIKLLNSNDNTITGNEISNHKNEIASNAIALQIINSDNNTFNYNTISNNDSPFEITESTNNKIYNNNFISNSNEGRIQSYVIEYGIILGVVSDTSGSNIFNLDLPVGGNYWDNFDQTSEGCDDIDSNNICDVSFVSFETQDNFAWTIPDGWSVNSPTIPDVDSLVIPEAVHCPNSEPILTTSPFLTLPVDDSSGVNEDTSVVICHMPLGNTDNPEKILVSMSAVDTHLAHGDHIGICEDYEPENQFSDEFLSNNETLNGAIEILTIVRENLNADSDLGNMISEAAQLHELFVNEDKTIKKAFQSAFKQFNKDVKAYYGDTQAVSETKLLNKLDKTALKIQIQISKAEKEEQTKNKIQSAIQFVNAQEELQKIKNQIGIEKYQYKTDNERLESLKAFELDLLKHTLFFTAKADGEEITHELLKDIQNWADENEDTGEEITPELLKDIQKWADEEEENHNDGNSNSGDSDKDKDSDSGSSNSGDSDKDKDSNSGSSNSGSGGDKDKDSNSGSSNSGSGGDKDKNKKKDKKK
jgi:parallel beta-helix repeat protein